MVTGGGWTGERWAAKQQRLVAGTEKPPPLTRGLKLIRADMTMPIPVAPGPQQRITDRNPRSRVTIALRTGGGSVVW